MAFKVLDLNIMWSFKLPNMFVTEWFNFTLEDGPFTKDMEVPFCSNEGLGSPCSCWVSWIGGDGSELDGTETTSFNNCSSSSLCFPT